MKNWFIFYTFPKSEKHLYKSLIKAGFEVYLPLQEQTRQWHDRKKKIILPLFPNYIFVKTDRRLIYEVLKFPRIVSYVKIGKKASLITDEEIELIQNIENNFSNIIVSNNVNRGVPTKISGGPLDGIEGIIEDNKTGKKITINIESISYSLKVSLTPKEILYTQLS